MNLSAISSMGDGPNAKALAGHATGSMRQQAHWSFANNEKGELQSVVFRQLNWNSRGLQT